MRAPEESPAIKVLKHQKGSTLILGKRSSQGLNAYTIEDVYIRNDIDDRNSGVYLNLGMLLPKTEKISFTGENTSIELFTSERRPFSTDGFWDQSKSTAHYISFIAPGSIIETSDKVHATRSIAAPWKKERDVVFGNSFLYPVFIRSGGGAE